VELKRLGTHDIVRQIGAGGMGEVYRAKDTKLGRDVALKILPGSFTNDPERVARFRREAQVLASLNHPQIAKVRLFRGERMGRTCERRYPWPSADEKDR
jgi:eukaryotic-like serine/threonine-protein kinase